MHVLRMKILNSAELDSAQVSRNHSLIAIRISQDLLSTISSVSQAIQRHVVSEVVTRTETTLWLNENVTMCSEDHNNDTMLIMTSCEESSAWKASFGESVGLAPLYLQAQPVM